MISRQAKRGPPRRLVDLLTVSSTKSTRRGVTRRRPHDYVAVVLSLTAVNQLLSLDPS
jgi:hypothetical protein